ncbi:Uncharacterised protein [Chlamydia abortus]|nr:Uncharacterised protein [Chlamydia abortus]
MDDQALSRLGRYIPYLTGDHKLSAFIKAIRMTRNTVSHIRMVGGIFCECLI